MNLQGAKEPEPLNELKVTFALEALQLRVYARVSRRERRQMRLKNYLHCGVCAEIGTCLAYLRDHIARSRQPARSSPRYATSKCFDLTAVVERGDVAQITHIPHDALRLGQERILPKHKRLVGVPGRVHPHASRHASQKSGLPTRRHDAHVPLNFAGRVKNGNSPAL